ncbi:hypothetical protein [Pusillimonas minor]|uniref:DUF4351 domain-containing protein n=1 Tax=Pusillimonas minor TaxID=2697024 RepID=A0A842HLT3_9BURK|nr:hypothetical protein [Pusillimonas minor]MBC2768300.1 hypothetical protein [Pusillimonas minor]
MFNTAVNPDFDGIWKDALTRWLPDCIELFWPEVHAQVDWHIAPVLLDKELQSLRKINKRSVRYVDHLAQLQLLGGSVALLLIHIEVQAGKVSLDLAQRMLVYRFRLMEKHPHHSHFSCAILLDRADGADTESYRAAVGSNELLFTFPVINLAKWAARTDELRDIAPNNPFAVVVLAQLACRATQASAESRLVSKLELAKLLKYWGYDVDQRTGLLRIIDSLLLLPEELDNNFFNTLTLIEDEQTMAYITSIERIYWQRHIDERKQGWFDEGSTKGAANVLQTLLQQKFGPLPDWAADQIHQADTSTLQRWAVNVLNAQTLQAVFEQ